MSGRIGVEQLLGDFHRKARVLATYPRTLETLYAIGLVINGDPYRELRFQRDDGSELRVLVGGYFGRFEMVPDVRAISTC